jgi:hypothetical protein
MHLKATVKHYYFCHGEEAAFFDSIRHSRKSGSPLRAARKPKIAVVRELFI